MATFVYILYLALIILPIFLTVLTVIKILQLMFPFFFWGATDMPSRPEKIKKMVEMCNIQSGQKTVDLGCGDGRIVVAMAMAGAKSYGFEINPFLVKRAKKRINQNRLNGRAFVYLKNMWNENLSDFDVVIVYAMQHVMRPLEDKLKRELRPGTKVVSNYFQFANWKPVQEQEDVYLYII